MGCAPRPLLLEQRVYGRIPHVQGIVLNHMIFAGEERSASVGNGTAL